MPLYDPTIWDSPSTQKLLTMVMACNNKAQAKAILGDLLTKKEIKELSQRLAIAQKLHNGSDYKTIQEDLGASTATIAEVSKWLHKGGGGYSLMLKMLEQH